MCYAMVFLMYTRGGAFCPFSLSAIPPHFFHFGVAFNIKLLFSLLLNGVLIIIFSLAPSNLLLSGQLCVELSPLSDVAPCWYSMYPGNFITSFSVLRWHLLFLSVCSVEISENRVSLADKALIDSAKRGDIKRFVSAYQKGGNMLQTDNDGMTVLHNAARFNYKDIVQFIIVNGPGEIVDMLDRDKLV